MAPVDVQGELERANSALPGIEITSLASGGSAALNNIAASKTRPAQSPYKAQYLPERDADRERKRCAAVKIRIAELDTQIAL